MCIRDRSSSALSAFRDHDDSDSDRSDASSSYEGTVAEFDDDEFEELKNRYESSVSESLKEFNSVSLKLGEDNEFTFELNDEMKQKVQERMNGINEYYSNFVSANGVDYNNMKETIAKELFFDQILKSAVEANINKGEINAVKEINNVVDKSKKSQAPSSNASVQDQIIDGFLKGQGIR